ncbi:MAG: ASKHA domain-containing protein [Desulfosporosinus sp.]|nr:ASKHA domain-containing protein [Desulfosporosinus sp.]
MVTVTFLPLNKVVKVPSGDTIFQAAVAAGVPIQSACGGKGTCGKCKVQIPVGKLVPEPTDGKGFLNEAERAAGWVLACMYTLSEDLTVRLGEQNDAFDRKLSMDNIKGFRIEPSIHKVQVLLEQPSVTDQTPDWERLLAALPNLEIPFNRRVAANLPKTLRQANFRVTVVRDGNDLLAVEPGDTEGRQCGLAIDIGTTTVVVYIMDLTDGSVISSGATTNPQHVFGADVISRISYAASGPDQVSQLQAKVIDAINGIIANLCAKTGVSHQEIYQTTVVGNTTMSHLFLGIDPTYLAPAPFIPVFRQTIEVTAKELGLNILETGKVIVLPNIAGYVGSDTVGVMLAAGVDRLAGISLAIDIGTNGEMVLASEDRILTCSTAAGPAFEGAEIKCGMRAAEGAIEGVRIGENVELDVIADTKPRGICGSGLIDAIAAMRKIGVIEATGRLVNKPAQLEKLPSAVRERLRRNETVSEFVLVWGKDSATGEDIVLTQKDIRELQLAKGAIRAGISILLLEMGIDEQAIDRILLAGAFGNYIKKESALAIGLLPPVLLERIETIGNAAGDGAKMALLSVAERARARVLSYRAEHVELSTRKDFQKVFISALLLQ